jgi:hypothetical protein
MKHSWMAAMPLLGWYLMAPPPLVSAKALRDAANNKASTADDLLRSARKVDLNAPLTRWVMVRTFDAADACEQFKIAMTQWVGTPQGKAMVAKSSARSFYVEQIGDAQCVASDDPRLRH